MRFLLKSFLLLLVAFTCQNKLKAQTFELEIDSLVGIPDTVFNGEDVSFYMLVSMNSPLFYQGNIFVELEYGGDFYEVDSTTVASQALSPNGPNYIQVHHRFSTDNDLNIGDNVVVVWPRIGDGVSPSQTVVNPYTTVVTLTEPNGIQNVSSDRTFQSVVYPNPAQNSVRIRLDDKVQIESVIVYDLSGKVLIRESQSKRLDVSRLSTGLYLVDVVTQQGDVYSDKLLISY